jgi:phosphoribosylformylglycinamidine cyclo-ligase
MTASNPYSAAGVDTEAGDRAVELMKSAIAATHGPDILGGVGGFAGLMDVSFLKDFRRPILATSTDGVGTKVAIAQALDVHHTIGHDLVGMVVDDIVVVGAKPLFMTDYIACGKVVPERIADIVRGIAEACALTGTALVGGETAEHPGLLGELDYDVAGAAVGAVEADEMLGADRVQPGDVVIAMASSGLHSNGYSLVRHILANRKLAFDATVPEFDRVLGLELLEPTRLYTTPLLDSLAEHPGAIHALSHVTGGGIAANLSRVLPRGVWVDLDRSTWSPSHVFRVLSEWSGDSLESTEGTWNLGIGMLAVVSHEAASTLTREWTAAGIDSWVVGHISDSEHSLDGYVTSSKGVDGGAVRLVGNYAD